MKPTLADWDVPIGDGHVDPAGGLEVNNGAPRKVVRVVVLATILGASDTGNCQDPMIYTSTQA